MNVTAKVSSLSIASGALVGLSLCTYVVAGGRQAAEARIGQLERRLRAGFHRNARLQVETAARAASGRTPSTA